MGKLKERIDKILWGKLTTKEREQIREQAKSEFKQWCDKEFHPASKQIADSVERLAKRVRR